MPHVGTTSLVLQRFLGDTDVSALVQLVVAFMPPPPTWLLAFSDHHTEETCLADLQYLHAHQIPEPDVALTRARDHELDGCTFMDEAAARGFLSVVQFLHKHSKIGCTRKATDIASRNGHFQVVRYLHEVANADVSWRAWHGAAENGHWQVLQYFHQIHTNLPAKMRPAGRAWGGVALEAAAKRNGFEMVKWLYWNRPERSWGWLLLKVIQMGYTELAIFLYENGDTEQCHAAIECAARAGRLDLIQYFHNKTAGRGFTSSTMDDAAAGGHLEVVIFLHQHRTEDCTTAAIDQAAQNGHLDIVQYLHHNRTEGCTRHAMNEAAINGHLDVVQFLDTHRQEGCTKYGMDQAAINGHLDVLQYIYENRTERCRSTALDKAAWNGHLEVVQFLHTNRRKGWYPSRGLSRKTIQKIVANGYMDVLQFLLDHSLVKLDPEDFETWTSSSDWNWSVV